MQLTAMQFTARPDKFDGRAANSFIKIYYCADISPYCAVGAESISLIATVMERSFTSSPIISSPFSVMRVSLGSALSTA